MSYALLWRLDELRAYLDMPFIITSGTQGLHSRNSAHYSGRAVDFVPRRDASKSLVDILFDVLRFDFTGVGIYPQWNGGGGFHVEHVQGVKPRRLWMAYYEKHEGKRVQVYSALNLKNLTLHGATAEILKRGKK